MNAKSQNNADDHNRINSKIHDLPVELLMRIFELNTDMDEDPESSSHTRPSVAFMALLSSSLVCRLWRQILLVSPALWGQVLDLNSLLGMDRDWWDELLGRTRNAPLHVKADMTGGRDIIQYDFLKEILKEHWNRLQVFDIRVPSHLMRHFIPTLRRPSVSLETFRVRVATSFRFSNSFDVSEIFSNTAPMLREVLLDVGDFNLCSPWASQLQKLTIVHPATDLHAHTLLQALSQMPMLEFLELRHAFNTRAIRPLLLPTLEPIHIPRLRRMMIVSKQQNCIPFLQNLTIPPNCRLHLDLSDCTNESILPLKNILTKLIEQYFTHFDPNERISLNVHVAEGHFAMKEAVVGSQENFYVWISQGQLLPATSTDSYDLLCAFKSFKLPSITSLSIIIMGNSSTDSAIRSKLESGMESFGHIFPSLEILETTPYTLDTLFTHTLFFDIALHKLRIVRLSGQSISINPLGIEALRTYFLNREVHRLRMPTLCLAHWNPGPSLRHLSDISNLEIIWRDAQSRKRTFVCGEGRDSGILDFSGVNHHTNASTDI